MTPDGELLGRYAETKSEDAFEELVRRHIDLVYSAALRQVNGDAALAQDVAQTVFANLAHKAAFLSRRPVLTGWLYTSTRFAAANSVRTEHRRHTREQEAQAMHELLDAPTPDPDWEKLRPLLDKVMHELRDSDRTIILMRYFENGSFAEIGQKLGLSEEAARKRVDRALEKLRGYLFKIKRGAQTIMVAAMLEAENQQGRPAANDVLLSFALTRSLKDEPVVISQLVRVAVVSVSLSALEQVFNRTAVPPESLSELAQTFEDMEKSDANGEGFNRSLIGERVMVMNHFKRATIPDLVSAVADGTTDEQRQLFVKRLKRFGGIKAEQAHLEVVFQRFLSACKEPFPERLSNSGDIQQQASENHDGVLLLNNAWLT